MSRLIDADKIVYVWQIDADGQEHDGVTLESIIKKMPIIETDLTAEEWKLVKQLRSYHNGSYAQVLDKLIAAASQPEITHCRDCAKLQIDNIFHDYWCDGKRVRLDHYCGYAERWEE